MDYDKILGCPLIVVGLNRSRGRGVPRTDGVEVIITERCLL